MESPTKIDGLNKAMTQLPNLADTNSYLQSHSVRVGFITKFLKTVPLQKVSSIIGHQKIESTMSYQRYVINKEEIQEILKKSFE